MTFFNDFIARRFEEWNNQKIYKNQSGKKTKNERLCVILSRNGIVALKVSVILSELFLDYLIDNKSNRFKML